MAHWIIEDRGFAGSYYKCSNCKSTFNDLYHDVDDYCPNCGDTINEDENEYTDDKPSDYAYKPHLLTNKEAAGLIKNMLKQWTPARGSTKSMMQLRIIEALSKAAYVLENTPDEVDN